MIKREDVEAQKKAVEVEFENTKKQIQVLIELIAELQKTKIELQGAWRVLDKLLSVETESVVDVV